MARKIGAAALLLAYMTAASVFSAIFVLVIYFVVVLSILIPDRDAENAGTLAADFAIGLGFGALGLLGGIVIALLTASTVWRVVKGWLGVRNVTAVRE